MQARRRLALLVYGCLSGKATINTTDETFALTVTAPGGTKLTYARDADGNRTVSGRWFGRGVSAAV